MVHCREGMDGENSCERSMECRLGAAGLSFHDISARVGLAGLPPLSGKERAYGINAV